jgi:hypothetical protein
MLNLSYSTINDKKNLNLILKKKLNQIKTYKIKTDQMDKHNKTLSV